MSDIKVIVLDFDGVIVDSESGKRNAWATLFSTFKDPNGFVWSSRNVEPLIANALSVWTGGEAKGSRYEIIEHIMDAVGYPKSDELITRYVVAYSELAERVVMNSGVSDDARSSIASLSGRVPLYVNSGTPEDALVHIMHELELDVFFKGVFGKRPENRDTSKVDNLRSIASQEACTPRELLFVGDLESDYDAAQAFGCEFVRFNTFAFGKSKTWSAPAPREIEKLSELVHFLA